MGKKILVAEGAAFMRMMMRDALEKQGYEILEAAEGKQCLETYRAEKPDLVIMDPLDLPSLEDEWKDKNGVDVLRMLRAEAPPAKVLICSAMSGQSVVMECIKSGAADFLAKPFKPEDLIDRVKKLCG